MILFSAHLLVGGVVDEAALGLLYCTSSISLVIITSLISFDTILQEWTALCHGSNQLLSAFVSLTLPGISFVRSTLLSTPRKLIFFTTNMIQNIRVLCKLEQYILS